MTAKTTKHTVTLAMLRKKGACPTQVALFKKLFGSSVRVTRARCLRHAADFNWGWAVNNLLSDDQQNAYYEATAPAKKAYDEAAAVASQIYNGAVDAARKVYEIARAPHTYEAVAVAWKAHNEAVAAAWKARNEAVAVTWNKLNEARAVAFYTAFTS